MNTPFTTKTNKIIIVGGGAAGMLAAVSASENGAHVTLVERNRMTGMKLNITGKGRCNVTNDCDVRTFLENVPRNPKFLYKALTLFPPSATVEFFENRGLPLKTERGRRVFPQSDKAQDVTAALRRAMTENGVTTVNGYVTSLIIENGRCGGVVYRAAGKNIRLTGDSVIIATGGMSYPKTGSDGTGYRLAESAGHTVTPLRPSLVPLDAEGRICRDLTGLSLKNVGVKFFENDKLIYEDFGEMLFTHTGVSGPVILSASAYIGSFPVKLLIDLKPALDEKTLDNRILSDFSSEKNRIYANSLSALLPKTMVDAVVALSGIPPEKQVNAVTKEERHALVSLLKAFPVTLTGTRPIDEAVVTRGGIAVGEINPSTMESKLVSGLYFAGEIIDVDAYTGGYNLQIAFSTGHLAGVSASI